MISTHVINSILVWTIVSSAPFSSAPSGKTLVPLLNGRIVGGSDIPIEERPFQLSLRYFDTHICGASIISDIYAVTSAHCTDQADALSLSLRAGSSSIETGGVIIQVGAIYTHPEFDSSTLDYDVTVLELTVPLEFGPGIQPFQLPEENQVVDPGLPGLVSGWGQTGDGSSTPTQLQGVVIPIVSQEDCRTAYGASTVTDRMLCAGLAEGGKDFCSGDTGGPLSIGFGPGTHLVGIASWGYGCGRPGYPGVYASVPNLRSFIAEITGL